MRNCPNCHQPVGASDDICENCGAVLDSALAAPTFTAASASMQLPAAIPSAVITATTPAVCPNCHSALQPGDDICEQCGMVVTATTNSAVVNPTSTPTAQQCPQCHGPRIPGVKFCNRCGFSYVGVTGPTTLSNSTSVASPSSTLLVVGNILNNKYEIIRVIGAGGMGAVYLAYDQVLKRQVVIKALLSDDDPDMVAQSVKEREFLAAIKHANIVSIRLHIS